MRLLSIIVCEACIVDVRTNNVSLINVLEEVAAVSFPTAIGKLAVVALFEKDASEPNNPPVVLHVWINDQQITELPMVADFQDRSRSRMIAELQGMPIIGPGQIRFSITHEGSEMGSWKIDMNSVGLPHVFSSPTGPSGPSS